MLGSMTTPQGVVLFNFAAMWELHELTEAELEEWESIKLGLTNLTRDVLNRRVNKVQEAKSVDLNHLPDVNKSRILKG